MGSFTIRLVAAGVLLAACAPAASTDTSADTSTSSAASPSPAVASTTAATSTTAAVSTTTTTGATTTTTVRPTTTANDPPPGVVTGIVVGLGAGSGEIDISWDRNPEPDVDRYEIWWSATPGGSKTLVDVVPHDTARLGGLAQDLGGGRTAYVDVNGRSQTPGGDCYELRAVDAASNEGPFSAEVCLPDPPPGQVAELTVGEGGGSLEISVVWRRNGETDIDHYEIWYSEQPGQAKSLLVTVPHDPSQLGGRSQDLGDGRTQFIDSPRDWIAGTNCYQVAAVDAAGQAGPRSAEVCYRP